MDMTLSFDLDDLLASTGETLTEEDKAALELLENLEMSYIVNLETGMVYISCPALDTVLGTAEGTWYSMDLNAIYGEALGHGFEQPDGSGERTFGERCADPDSRSADG